MVGCFACSAYALADTKFGSVPSSPRLVLDQRSDHVILSSLSYYKITPIGRKGELRFEDVYRLPNQAWTPLRTNPNFGYTSDSVWFKHELLSVDERNLVLEIDRPYLDVVDIYLLSESGESQRFQLGDHRPYDQRPIAATNLQVPLHFDSGERYSLYIYVNSRGAPIQFEASLMEPQKAAMQNNYRMLLYVTLGGSALVMGLYYLFLFFATRDVNYLLYTAQTVGLSSSLLLIQGYFYQFYPSHDPLLENLLLIFSGFIYRCCTCLFVLGFLQIKTRQPKLRWIFYYYLGIEALLLCTLFINGNVPSLITLGLFNAFTLFPLIFVISAWSWFKGSKVARFTTVGWGIFSLTLSYYFLMLSGLIDYHPWAAHCAALGILSEMVLLAMALADRLNIARQNENRMQIMSYQSVADTQQLLETRNQLLSSQLAEARAREDADEALRASKTKSEFLATMSHEIRTPMNGVLGMAELLAGTELNETQQRYVKTINDSGKSLLTVINDVLDFSKIEAGKMRLVDEEFDLEALIDSCVEIFALRCLDKKLELISCLAPGIPRYIIGDSVRLRQVLLNLLGNALKFTEQGEVTLKVIPLELREGDNSSTILRYIRFEISDTGIGIPEEVQGQLFQSFVQGGDSVSRQFGGTGLGLSISRQLVELMQGRIAYKSREAGGTCFYVELPCRPASQSFIAAQSTESYSLRGKKVLIVDDCETFSEFCQLSCTSWGLKADKAFTAAQAMQQLEDSEGYDVVIIDIMLPDSDGYALQQKIETSLLIKAQPAIVFISAMQLANKGMAQVIHQGACVPYLEKPIGSARLRDAVGQVLRIRSPSKQDSVSTPSIAHFRGTKKLPSLQHLRVLVVDDNAVNRMVISGQLQQMHIYADVVENGRQAVDAVVNASRAYHLILMDCEMPEMDGYQASREIRLLGKKQLGHVLDHLNDDQVQPNKPVILALTAMISDQVASDALAAGMDGYMSKPIGLESLAQQITQRFSHLDRMTVL
jgi:signal transduction histidine kinase/DNA-binding response OmpR family regulator